MKKRFRIRYIKKNGTLSHEDVLAKDKTQAISTWRLTHPHREFNIIEVSVIEIVILNE